MGMLAREGRRSFMADNPNPLKKRWTREQFKEEVAQELGIDISTARFPRKVIDRLEQDLHGEEEAPSPSD